MKIAAKSFQDDVLFEILKIHRKIDSLCCEDAVAFAFYRNGAVLRFAFCKNHKMLPFEVYRLQWRTTEKAQFVLFFFPFSKTCILCDSSYGVLCCDCGKRVYNWVREKRDELVRRSKRNIRRPI